ncbi:oligosaccharide flippase family protein [Oxalobacteraceae bacterium A2-2]
MATNKVISSVLWSVAKNWGGRFTSLVVFAVLTRLLDAHAVGAVAFVSAILAVLTSLAEMGLAEYLIYRNDTPQARRQIFWFQVYVTGTIFVLAAVIGPPVLRAVGQDDAARVFPWLCLILPMTALMSVQDAIQRRLLQFRGVAMRTLAGMVVGGVLGVATALAGGGMWSLVVKQVAETAVGAALLWRMSDWRPGWRTDWTGFREIFDYGRYLAGGRLLDVITTNIDDLIVGLAIGQRELGMYSIGKKLYVISSELLGGVAQQIAGPFFARAKGDSQVLWQMLVKVMGYTAWLIIPLYAALHAVAFDVIVLLFGQKWAGAVWVLQCYCFVGMIMPLFLFHWPLLMASGSAARSFRYSLVRNLGGITIISLASLGGWGVFVYGQVARVLFNVGVGETLLRGFLPFSRMRLWRALLPGLATAAAVTAVAAALRWLGFGALPWLAMGMAPVLGLSYLLMFKKFKIDRQSQRAA